MASDFQISIVSFLLAGIISLSSTDPAKAGAIIIKTEGGSGRLHIKTWRDFRDDRIVKQQLDYSCGSAALATLLKEYYGHDNVTEATIIEQIGIDGEASFADLARVANGFGYRAVGLSIDFQTLSRFQIPAIVYLKPESRAGSGHFSVFRGFTDDGLIWLADPAWGNRKLRKENFIKLWKSTNSDHDGGKVLALVEKGREGFFAYPSSFSISRLRSYHRYKFNSR